MLYTVMVTSDDGKCRYIEGVGGEQISYRKVEANRLAARAEKENHHTVNLPDSTSNVSLDERLVPSSITCSSGTNRNAKYGKVQEHTTKRHKMTPQDTTILGNHELGKSSINVGSFNSNKNSKVHITMRLPLWLQKDRACQRQLFCEIATSSLIVISVPPLLKTLTYLPTSYSG